MRDRGMAYGVQHGIGRAVTVLEAGVGVELGVSVFPLLAFFVLLERIACVELGVVHGLFQREDDVAGIVRWG